MTEFQVELTGSSVFDYVHQSDHLELAEQLGVNLAHQQRLSSSSSSHHSSPLNGTGTGTYGWKQTSRWWSGHGHGGRGSRALRTPVALYP